jgi:hypothetical protein
MARMVRKQFYITQEQNRLLKRRAKALGVSEAELVRRGVETADEATGAFVPDLAAWAELRRDMEKRARMQAPQTGRGWTRDELYDRLDRFAG